MCEESVKVNPIFCILHWWRNVRDGGGGGGDDDDAVVVVIMFIVGDYYTLIP